MAPIAGAAQRTAGTDVSDGGWTLGEVDVVTGPIYTPDQLEHNAVRRLIEATHWTTRESVVRRETWKKPGDAIDQKFAEELERNLRSTGLFAEATVELVPRGDDSGVADLVIRTRDRLSISGGASGSFVGDIASGGFSLSERNLFGTGDRVGFSFFENDLGEFRGTASYTDRYLFGSWTTGSARLGRTDDGPFASFSIDRPFRYLADDFAWGVSGSSADLDQDYFAADENVAEVPFEDERLSASATWRFGTRERFATAGLRARTLNRLYGAARGVAAASVRVPADTRTVFGGFAFSATNIRRFDKVTGVDTIRFVQDVELSTSGSVEFGATYRDEENADGRAQPTASVRLSDRRRLGPTTLFSGRIDAGGRFVAGDAVGWLASAEIAAFDTRFKSQTLGVALRMTEVNETEDLPVQLVLGEGRGLRGYPRNQFTGQRIASITLEDRIDLDARIGTLDFGAVVFADLGWATERGESFGQPLRAAGVGLRIGSNPLFGSGVLRFDVSFPLDDVNGESFDPLFSFSLGQTFGVVGR